MRAQDVAASQQSTSSAPQLLKATRKLNSDVLDDAKSSFDRYQKSELRLAESGARDELASGAIYVDPSYVDDATLSSEQSSAETFSAAGLFDEALIDEAVYLREEAPVSLTAKNALSSYTNVERINVFSQSNLSQIVGVDITV